MTREREVKGRDVSLFPERGVEMGLCAEGLSAGAAVCPSRFFAFSGAAEAFASLCSVHS